MIGVYKTFIGGIMKEGTPPPHWSLLADVDAGILTQEEADKIASGYVSTGIPNATPFNDNDSEVWGTLIPKIPPAPTDNEHGEVEG